MQMQQFEVNGNKNALHCELDLCIALRSCSLIAGHVRTCSSQLAVSTYDIIVIT